MSGMDRLTDEALEGHIELLLDAQQDINLAANQHMNQALCDASALLDTTERFLRELLAHRRASQVAPAPSDGLREALEECDCCVDGLQADGETPCPYCTKPRVPVVDAAEALLEAHKSGAWPVGQGRTLEQVAMIIAALRAALSTPTEERQ